MKSLLAFLITLSMSLPTFAAGKPARKPASYKLENGTFSSLILSPEEFNNLNNRDRMIYLQSMMALMQIIEASQSQIMGKIDRLPAKKTSQVEVEESHSRLSAWLSAFIEKAEAAGPLAIFAGAARFGKWALDAGIKAGPAVKAMWGKVSSYVSTATSKAVSNWGSKATAAASNPNTQIGAKVAQSQANIAANAAAQNAKAALEIGRNYLKTADKTKYNAALESVKKAKAALDQKGLSLGESKIRQANLLKETKKLDAEVRNLWKKSPPNANLGDLYKEAAEAAVGKNGKVPWGLINTGGLAIAGTSLAADNMQTIENWIGINQGLTATAGKKDATANEAAPATPPDNAKAAAGSGAEIKEPAAAAPPKIEALVQAAAEEQTAAAASSTPTGIDSATAAAAMAEQPPAAQAQAAKEDATADSPHAADKACIFGGRPSVWVDFGGQILCTRPADSANEKCNGANYQCPLEGIVVPGVDAAKELCVKLLPYKDLTVRCSKAFLAIVEKSKSELPEREYSDFMKNFAEYLAKVEKSDLMKDKDGNTKSIQAYCKGAKQVQAEECQAIMSVIAALKGTETVDQVASRMVAQNKPDGGATEPATPAQGTDNTP